MARRPDPAKTRLWSDRLKRFSDSSQTVTDFCRSEGVSVSAFHYWKRRLKNHALPTPNDALTTAPFLPVRLAEAAAPVPPNNGFIVRLPGAIEIAVGSDPSVGQLVLDKVLHASGVAQEDKPC